MLLFDAVNRYGMDPGALIVNLKLCRSLRIYSQVMVPELMISGKNRQYSRGWKYGTRILVATGPGVVCFSNVKQVRVKKWEAS